MICKRANRKYRLKACTKAVFLYVLVMQFSSYLAAAEYNITDFGATADCNTVNTAFIQKAIDTCSQNGGGTVVVPKGTFICGSLFLKPGTEIFLKKDATLKASENIDDFKVIVNLWAGYDKEGPAALINAGTYEEKGFKGVKIYGEGTLDGSGLKWWKEFWEYKEKDDKPDTFYNYPKLISVCNSSDILIEGLRLINSPFWNIQILYSDKIVCRDLYIFAPNAPVRAPSSDGIDIDSSKDVLIERCYISVEDDCISLKSGRNLKGLLANRPTENVIIRNCRFGAGHGVIDCGSEVSGSIRNVHAYNCIVDGLGDNDEKVGYYNPVVRFKTAPGRGGVIENLVYENFHIKNVARLISCEIPFGKDEHWKEKYKDKGVPEEKGYTKIRNVQIRNFTGECKNPGTIKGFEDITFENVVIENINIKATKMDKFIVDEKTVIGGVKFNNIRINGKLTNLTE